MSQLPPVNKTALNKKTAVEALWRRAVLHWKLDKNQTEMYKFVRDTNHKIIVIGSSRQLGKSYFLVTLAVEECLKNPFVIVKFIAPKAKDIKRIITPLIREITSDCPKELVPEYKSQDNVFKFKNGSEIQLAGTDNGHAESIRGNKAHLCIIDEAGFCDDLSYIVNSILIPTTTTTGGRIVMASTPSKSPDHDFMHFMNEAEADGRFIKKTIYDNPRLSEKEINALADALGGKESVDFRREYLVEKIKSEDDAVVPEFNKALAELIVKPWKRPAFCDTYVSMDIGIKDLTVVLFAYYDFRQAKVIIEDELVLSGVKMLTDNLAQSIRDIETNLWTSKVTGEVKPVTLRIADNNNLLLLNDLSIKHNLSFMATGKDNKEAALNNMRMLLRSHRIMINPKCKTLIMHLEGALWNKARTSYIRSPDKGHYDACFVPGSQVLTAEGYKNIEDIVVGDKVLTHLGNFKSVLSTMAKEYVGDLVNIKVSGRDLISCTPEHNFYAAETYKNSKDGYTGQIMNNPPTWLPAENLTLAHKVVIPAIPQMNKKVIKKELCFLYGYYVAEGSVGGNGHQISFAGHKKEKNVMDILKKALFETYGIGKSGVSRRSLARHKNGECVPRSRGVGWYNCTGFGRKIQITEKALRSDLMLLGKGKNKQFPDWIVDLDRDQAFYMLLGYLFGDGHFSKAGAKSGSISHKITEGVDVLARKCGITGNFIKYRRAGRYKGLGRGGYVLNDMFSWHLDKQQTEAIYNYIAADDMLAHVFADKLMYNLNIKNKYAYATNLKAVNSLAKTAYSGKVYNLEVEGDNSYTVNGVAVHNCDALAYLCRNINFNKNPYPPNYDIGEEGEIFSYAEQVPLSQFEKDVKQIFAKPVPRKIGRFGRK